MINNQREWNILMIGVLIGWVVGILCHLIGG
jgi:hypothetical protein